jgi:ketosteroid isomerase-like protein
MNTLHTTRPDRDLEALRALNARFIHNFVTNDVASHDAITHPRFVYLSSAGAKVDRATYLRDWASGFDPQVLPYWDLRDEHIEVFGDCALVRATNKHVRRVDGVEVTGMTLYTDTYVREGGRWLCVQAQLTEVKPAHYPPDGTIVCRYLDGVRQPAAG